jgi:hypothetical protein
MPKAEEVAEPKTPPSLDVVVTAGVADASDVQKLLSIISPNCSYERWFKVLCAISNTLGKDNDGVYDMADNWSALGKTYDARAFGKTWSSIKDAGTLSIATLHYLAKEENATLYGVLFPKGSRKGKMVDIYKSRNYADIKTTFEETVFKVIKPVTFYQKKSDGSGYIVTTEEKIKAAYRNVVYNKSFETKKKRRPRPCRSLTIGSPIRPCGPMIAPSLTRAAVWARTCSIHSLASPPSASRPLPMKRSRSLSSRLWTT